MTYIYLIIKMKNKNYYKYENREHKRNSKS